MPRADEFLLANLVNDLDLECRSRFNRTLLRVDWSVDRAVPERLFGDYVRLRRALALLFDCALRHLKAGSVTVKIRLTEPALRRPTASHRELELKLPPNTGQMNIDFVVTMFSIGGTHHADTQAFIAVLRDTATTANLDRYGNPARSMQSRPSHPPATGASTLAVFRALLAGLKGHCVSEALPGKACAMRISIPLYAPIDSLNKLIPANTSATVADYRRGHGKSGSGHRNSVLLVDDDRLGRNLLSDLLVREGYRVAEADSSNDALEKLSHDAFAAIIIDLLMPGVNGLQLAKCIRERHRHKPGSTGIPYLIALTAGLGGEFASSDHKRLFNLCLRKPVGLARVVQALETA